MEVPNFEHSEVLIRMTDETPLLLAPRDKFMTLNIYDRKFSVNFPTREDWPTECVDLVALVFFAGAELVPAYFLTFLMSGNYMP
jgi:hypothetical protein